MIRSCAKRQPQTHSISKYSNGSLACADYLPW